MARRIHGQSYVNGKRPRLYRVWCAMRERCVSPASKSYERYGARGIVVCAEWQSFPAFQEWALANGYDEGLSIDRIDNSGPYSAVNCRWSDDKTQARNRRSSRFLTYHGETKTLAEWAEDLGMVKSLRSRLHRGWSLEKAIETPLRAATK